MFDGFKNAGFSGGGAVRADPFEYGVSVVEGLAIEIGLCFRCFEDGTVKPEDGVFVVISCHTRCFVCQKKATRLWEAGRWYFRLLFYYHPPPCVAGIITTTTIIIAVKNCLVIFNACLIKEDVSRYEYTPDRLKNKELFFGPSACGPHDAI